MNYADNNSDGKVDRFRILINFKNKPSQLRKVRLLSVVDYRLRSKLKMQMQGMLDLQIDTPEGAARILSDGQIVLLQQKSALIDSITRTLYNKDPLADLNFEQYSVYDIVDKYNARNGKSNLLLFILIYSICRESLLRGKDHSAATRKQLFNNN